VIATKLKKSKKQKDKATLARVAKEMAQPALLNPAGRKKRLFVNSTGSLQESILLRDFKTDTN
jgi:hypothetical protein